MVRLIDAEALKEKMTVSALGGHMRIWVCGVIDDAPTVEPQSAWIPCSERMPDSEERCLVFTKGHNVGISRRMGRNLRGEWTCYGYEVTHWMPLPEPPKGEKSNER